MFNIGDEIIRITDVLGDMTKGTLGVVAEVPDKDHVVLEGNPTIYLQQHFGLYKAAKDRPTDLGKLTEALKTVDNWNRTHPTAMMVGIDPYPAQDGGMVVEVNGEGFNSPDDFYAYMSHYASKRDRKAALKRALKMMEVELEE